MHKLPQRKNSRGGSKLASRFVLTATTVVAASTAITVLASTPAMADTPAGPDRTQIISEFYDWWTPAPYDSTDNASRIATAFKGDVTAAGAPVLAHNDAFVQAINHAGEQNPGQQLRALEDADMVWTETLGDAFGPVLSSYLTDGVSQGALPLTSASIEDAGKNSTTGTSKTDFNFPRPFLRTDDSAKGGVGDRSRNGENNLQGLSPQLDIRRVADQGVRPDNGEIHSAGYDIFAGVSDKGPEGINQAFPSGHTTYAYGISLQLAELLPELAPEIITRGSEAANNRIVLGVHYPLDIMGGRVEGHVNTATRLSDADYISSTLLPARAELVNYLESRCAADGHGDTLHACIADTDANNAGGYTNTFTDPVSTAAVVDRSSALTAYTSRMTYGFDRTSAAGLAPVVPENAESLLVTAFPALNDAQRRAVLAATEIDSGFPFSSSSQGWQRINLPAALSSRVTVDLLGNVVKVEPGQGAPSVVNADLPGNGAGSVTGSLVGRV